MENGPLTPRVVDGGSSRQPSTDGSDCVEVEGASRSRHRDQPPAQRGASPPSHASMDDNDYAMMTEAIREMPNPLATAVAGGGESEAATAQRLLHPQLAAERDDGVVPCGTAVAAATHAALLRDLLAGAPDSVDDRNERRQLRRDPATRQTEAAASCFPAAVAPLEADTTKDVRRGKVALAASGGADEEGDAMSAGRLGEADDGALWEVPPGARRQSPSPSGASDFAEPSPIVISDPARQADSDDGGDVSRTEEEQDAAHHRKEQQSGRAGSGSVGDNPRAAENAREATRLRREDTGSTVGNASSNTSKASENAAGVGTVTAPVTANNGENEEAEATAPPPLVEAERRPRPRVVPLRFAPPADAPAPATEAPSQRPHKRVKLTLNKESIPDFASATDGQAQQQQQPGTPAEVQTPTASAPSRARRVQLLPLSTTGSVGVATPAAAAAGAAQASPFSPLLRGPGQHTYGLRSSSSVTTQGYDSATYTPVPGGTTPGYPSAELGGAPPARTTRVHSVVKVPIPLTPPAIDFSRVRRTVEALYRIDDKISEGTYGEVYVGAARATGQRVALKRLKVLRGMDGFPLTSLREVIALRHIGAQRERLAAAAASSASSGSSSGGPPPLNDIVALQDVLLSAADGAHDIYLVFPYATCSVAGLLSRRSDFFDMDTLVYLFRGIVAAAAQLHSMGVIHRDIKPDNVLLTAEGDVQLADFGLCVFRGGGRRALTPSMINLAYRPPEMLLGGRDYDDKVDVWSIGCFIAQVFLREPPFSRRRTASERERLARSTRSAATELGQLALVAEVLGPVPLQAFSPATCAHLRTLQELRASPALEAQAARLQPIFSGGMLFHRYYGFARWFEQRVRDINPAYGQHPLMPAFARLLQRVFHYDPRERPTALELLSTDPLRLTPGAAAPANARARLVNILRQSADSHLDPQRLAAAAAPAAAKAREKR